MAKIPITLQINRERHEALVEPDRTLLDVLRSDLGLTGTKTNCLDAECGVCTVLVDGLAVNSCLYLAVVPLAELARQSQVAGGGMIAPGTFIAPATAYDTKRVEGHVYPAFHSPSFHAHAVDLSVDAETGEVAIHKYVVAQDVGFALNPTYIEGQIEGGVAQGLGQTLSEEIVYRDGRVLNANLTDYKMPTTLDVPRVESILVEHPGRVGPFGAKGVGEPPNIEPPAAVANAIAAAVGARISSLPITAEKIVLTQRAGSG